MTDEDVIMPRCQTLDMSRFSQLVRIGGRFCERNSDLRIADFTALENLAYIGDKFMYKCMNLERIVFNRDAPIVEIGNHFLYNCSSLVAVDVSMLSALERLPDYFLGKCTVLRDLDLTELRNLKQIGYGFLAESHVSEVRFNLDIVLELIGNSFLHGSRIQYLDTRVFRGLTRIPNQFLAASSTWSAAQIEFIDLDNFPLVTEIGNEFLRGSNIRGIDFRGMTSLTHIGNNCLADCFYLHVVRLSTGLRKISGGFLERVDGLRIWCNTRWLNVLMKTPHLINHNFFNYREYNKNEHYRFYAFV